ncbi:damage-control phosphatase ARMT1 family protein [Pelodictyon luteolum]|nr:ARMT1-like domain-containing protein [Pelodictyon luteolum]
MDHKRSIPPACYPCLFQQLHSLVKITGMHEADGKRLFEHSMRQLLETGGEGIVVQHVVRSATDLAAALMDMGGMGEDEYDPYRAIKQRSNDLALTYAGEFRRKILEAPDQLAYGVLIAAAGNIIDFGAKQHGSLDVEAELRSLDLHEFGRFDFQEFSSRLATTRRLLYICDNAGEIVFDRLFIEILKRTYPELDVTCAVRERPVINDAVASDALYIGLDEVARVVSSGSVYPGTLTEETSPLFRQLFRDADLIISKGQGNFETLHAEADRRMFFILRIKCDPVAVLSGVAKGALVLMQGGGGM